MYASYAVHLTNASQQLYDKFRRTLPPPVNQYTPLLPEYLHDIYERINLPANVAQDSGPTAIIDEQPDFRYPLLTIESMVMQLYHNYDPKASTLITPPSMTAYCLALLYGLALINDTAASRTQQSQFASEFCSSPRRNELFIALSRAYVPPFLHAMFDALQRCRFTSKINLLVIYTLACADFRTDFGRIIPCTIFLQAHNLLATQPTNQHPSITTYLWLSSQVTEAPHQTSVANYFGQYLHQHTVPNWLYRTTRAMFNATLNRFHVTRPFLQQLPITPMPMAQDATTVNPYIFALGATDDNLSTLTHFVRDMSSAIEKQTPSNFQLAHYTKLEDQQTSLLNHYYSTPGLPTWHYAHTTLPAKNENAYPENSISMGTYATHLHYMQSPMIPLNVNIHQLNCRARVPHWLYLGFCQDPPADHVNNFRTVTRQVFDIDEDVLPRARHFCPVTPSPSEMRRSLSLGKVIESHEIDGFSVKQPDPDNPISFENSSFLESAIPLSKCHPGTFYNAPNNNMNFVAARVEHTDRRLPVQIDMLRLDQNRLPIIGGQIYEDEDPRLTGFNRDIIITNCKYASSAPSFGIVNHNANSPLHLTSVKPFYAWSSYRHYNTKQHRNVPRLDRTYFLMNFRPNFGTNVLMSETPHLANILTTS